MTGPCPDCDSEPPLCSFCTATAQIDPRAAYVLRSEDLFSKWGFGDGDGPGDAWYDWLEENYGVAYGDLDFPIAAVVRRHLLPALDQVVEVYDIETIHNPIRAASVDGLPATGDEELTPECVVVTFEEAYALARMRVIRGELVEPMLAPLPQTQATPPTSR